MPHKDLEVRKAYMEKWRAANRARIAELNVQRRDRLQGERTQWIQSQGGKCVQCGSSESLEVDHIDPGSKSPKLGHKRSVQRLAKAERYEEFAKCQVLCRACHRKKSGTDKYRNQKLNPERVREIRARWKAGGESMTTIGRDYNVTGGMVWNVVKGHSWAWVED